MVKKLGDSDKTKDEMPTSSFSVKQKQRKKKKLKDMMHVINSAQANMKIKMPKSNKAISAATCNLTRSKRADSSSDSPAMVRAQEVLSSLDPKFPSIVKTMVRSHVTSCFWLGLSTEFCNTHLPKKDMMVTLEDESGNEFQIVYLARKVGLSGGWKNFTVAHKLLEGDVVIFQLVEPLEPVKLKAYIIRANGVNKKSGAINPGTETEKDDLKMSPKALSSYTPKMRSAKKTVQCNVNQKKEKGPGKSDPKKLTQKKKNPSGKEPVSENQVPKQSKRVRENKETGSGKSVPETSSVVKKIKSINVEPDLEIITGPVGSSSLIQFKYVKSFEDFTIMANDICIDSEIPNDIRLKYYELCSSKKAFLHARLMQGLNSKLVAGIITETVHIADSVKTCSLTTCRSEYANWERALKSFHFLGMSVGFILVRIRKLMAIAFESEDAVQSRKYIEAKLERVKAEDELVTLKTKFLELKESYKKCSADVKALKSKAEGYERKFLEEVGAPW